MPEQGKMLKMGPDRKRRQEFYSALAREREAKRGSDEMRDYFGDAPKSRRVHRIVRVDVVPVEAT